MSVFYIPCMDEYSDSDYSLCRDKKLFFLLCTWPVNKYELKDIDDGINFLLVILYTLCDILKFIHHCHSTSLLIHTCI